MQSTATSPPRARSTIGSWACARSSERRRTTSCRSKNTLPRQAIWFAHPRRRGRCLTAPPTSSGPIVWCRRSRRSTACATRSSIRPSQRSTRASPSTEKRLPPDSRVSREALGARRRFGGCWQCRPDYPTSAGDVVATPHVAAAEILIRAVILPGIVVRARVVLIAPGPAGIEAGTRIIASSTGVTTREIAPGVAAVVVVDDGLAEPRRHPCPHQAAGVVGAEQRRYALEQ